MPTNIKRIFNQRQILKKAIELLNEKEPDRGNFWVEYMPKANRVIPKDGGRDVAVAFFFNNYVIVEFAPSGNAAYLYKRDVFEKNLLKSRDILGWKSKKDTHVIPDFTRKDGTLYHTPDWQENFSSVLNVLIGRK